MVDRHAAISDRAKPYVMVAPAVANEIAAGILEIFTDFAGQAARAAA
jgi:hypothetical protein